MLVVDECISDEARKSLEIWQKVPIDIVYMDFFPDK